MNEKKKKNNDNKSEQKNECYCFGDVFVSAFIILIILKMKLFTLI